MGIGDLIVSWYAVQTVHSILVYWRFLLALPPDLFLKNVEASLSFFHSRYPSLQALPRRPAMSSTPLRESSLAGIGYCTRLGSQSVSHIATTTKTKI